MIGEFLAAKPARMPRISPFDINSLQESAASLLSCAPIVERESSNVSLEEDKHAFKWSPVGSVSGTRFRCPKSKADGLMTIQFIDDSLARCRAIHGQMKKTT